MRAILSKLAVTTALLMCTPGFSEVPNINDMTVVSGGKETASVVGSFEVMPVCDVMMKGTVFELSPATRGKSGENHFLYSKNGQKGYSSGSVFVEAFGYNSFEVSHKTSYANIELFDSKEENAGKTYLGIHDRKGALVATLENESGAVMMEMTTSSTEFKIGSVFVNGGKSGFRRVSGSAVIAVNVSCYD